jgi:hypothetical protein
MSEVSAEDQKLITLARGARGRIGAPAGAAVRDETGRTYASASVHLESVGLTAVQAAVIQAAASGARGLEAVVLVGDEDAGPGIAAARDLGGGGILVLICATDGTVSSRTIT